MMQTALHRRANLGTVHFVFQRTRGSPRCHATLSHTAVVRSILSTIPSQLTRDDRRTPAQSLRNGRLSESTRIQMSYTVTFFQTKMLRHRRDSVPKESDSTTVLGNTRHGLSGRPVFAPTLTYDPCISV